MATINIWGSPITPATINRRKKISRVAPWLALLIPLCCVFTSHLPPLLESPPLRWHTMRVALVSVDLPHIQCHHRPSCYP